MKISQEKVKRYVHVPKPNTSAGTALTQNLPMVAMFLRNKPVAWATLLLAVQSWLNEPLIADPADESQPAAFRVLFALVALLVAYMDLFFPPPVVA